MASVRKKSDIKLNYFRGDANTVA